MARQRPDDRRPVARSASTRPQRWGIARLKARLAAMMRRVPLARDGTARVGQRYIFILPTGTGLVLAVVLLVTLAGSLNYQNNLGLLFTFILASAAVVSMHQTWLNLLGLEVWASAGPGVFAGDEAEFTITLRDPSQRDRTDLRLRGWVGRVHPVALAAGAQDRVTLTVPSERRGRLTLGTVPIETEFPLGLFRAWCLIDSDASIIVFPRPAPVAPLPPPVASAGSARAQGDRGEGADDFIGPRSYRPGDSPRRLDWKALARERGLVVKQFGGDRAEELWLDWDQVDAADTETRLSRLCRQVLDAAEAHVRFGLRLPGRTLPLDSGDAHRLRCLEALATFGQDPL